MYIVNRVLLSILFGLLAVASLVGALIAFGAITPQNIQSVAPFQSLVNLFRDNLVAASLASIMLLSVLLALGVLWLRALYAESFTTLVGGEYGLPEKGLGETLVNYAVVSRSIDNEIRGVPGVIDSITQIYSQRDGQLFAHSSLLLRRNANIHEVDRQIKNLINRGWTNRLGIELARHDITISLEPMERRVA